MLRTFLNANEEFIGCSWFHTPGRTIKQPNWRNQNEPRAGSSSVAVAAPTLTSVQGDLVSAQMWVPRPVSGSFRRRDLLLCAGIFVLALLVRLIYLLQIKDDSVCSVLLVDARTYDRWAQEIAAGNWLGNKIFYQAPLY